MIERDLKKATENTYDLIIVGGGVYGAALAMESARRGLRPMLLERDDFGSATSWNSLRILHGGLRYLQNLDLQRFRETVEERTWFCRHFPELVEPLECMMPLYGRGLRRPSAFRVALWMNDYLSRRRNDHVRPDRHLPNGRVLGVEETRQKYPGVPASGLRGAGLWWDAAMRHAPRVLVEMLRWASANEAVALNYVEVRELLLASGRVQGVLAVERFSGEELRFEAPVVVNCAGPWSRALAASFDRDDETIFRPSLAFNVLLDREPLSDCAIAVAPPAAGSRTYFMYPRGERIFAGTFHAPWHGEASNAVAGEQAIDKFLTDLNEAVPGFDLSQDDVLRVYAGLLPAKTTGGDDLADREVVKDHSQAGGQQGLYTVSGVKFTTARLVALKTLRNVFGDRRDLAVRPDTQRPEPRPDLGFGERTPLAADASRSVVEALRRIIEAESVLTMDDLLLRRTDWGHDPRQRDVIAERVRALVGWEGESAPPPGNANAIAAAE